MANKESPDDLIDKNDDWDFDDDGFGGMDSFGGEDEEDDGERKPKNSFKSSVNKSLTHVGKETSKGVALGIATGIGKGMPAIKDTYDLSTEALSEVNRLRFDIYDKSRPVINEFKIASKKLLQQTKGLVPFGLDQKLLNFLEKHSEQEEDKREVDVKQQRESKLTEMLNDVFTLQTQKAMEQQKIESTNRIIDEQLTSSRHKESIDVMSSIKNALIYQTAFTKSIFTSYLKKDLELKVRHLYVAQDQLNVMNVTTRMLEQRLDAIVKNTGLPDAQKITTTETARRMMKERFIKGIGEKANDMFATMSQKFMSEYVDPALEQISTLSSLMDAAGSTIESMDEAKSMGFGGDEIDWRSKTGLAGMAGGHAGGFIGTAIARKLFNKLPKSVRTIVQNSFGGGRLGFLQSLHSLSYKMGGAGEILRNILPNMRDDDTITNLAYTNGSDAGTITNRTITTIEQIIPGYLKMQTRFLGLLATRKDPGLLEYDFRSQSFKTAEQKSKEFASRTFNVRDSAYVVANNAKDTMELVDTLGSETKRETLRTTYNDLMKSVEELKISLAMCSDYVTIDESTYKALKGMIADPKTISKNKNLVIYKYGISKLKENVQVPVMNWLVMLFTDDDGETFNAAAADQFQLQILKLRNNLKTNLKQKWYDEAFVNGNTAVLEKYGTRDKNGNIVFNHEAITKEYMNGLTNENIKEQIGNERNDIDRYGNELTEKKAGEVFFDKIKKWAKDFHPLDKLYDFATGDQLYDLLEEFYVWVAKQFGTDEKDAIKAFRDKKETFIKWVEGFRELCGRRWEDILRVKSRLSTAITTVAHDFFSDIEATKAIATLVFVQDPDDKYKWVFKSELTKKDLAQFMKDSSVARDAIEFLRDHRGSVYVKIILEQFPMLKDLLPFTDSFDRIDPTTFKKVRVNPLDEILKSNNPEQTIHDLQQEIRVNNTKKMGLTAGWKKFSGLSKSNNSVFDNFNESNIETFLVESSENIPNYQDEIIKIISQSNEHLYDISGYVRDVASMMYHNKPAVKMDDLRKKYESDMAHRDSTSDYEAYLEKMANQERELSPLEEYQQRLIRKTKLKNKLDHSYSDYISSAKENAKNGGESKDKSFDGNDPIGIFMSDELNGTIDSRRKIEEEAINALQAKEQGNLDLIGKQIKNFENDWLKNNQKNRAEEIRKNLHDSVGKKGGQWREEYDRLLPENWIENLEGSTKKTAERLKQKILDLSKKPETPERNKTLAELYRTYNNLKLNYISKHEDEIFGYLGGDGNATTNENVRELLLGGLKDDAVYGALKQKNLELNNRLAEKVGKHKETIANLDARKERNKRYYNEVGKTYIKNHGVDRQAQGIYNWIDEHWNELQKNEEVKNKIGDSWKNLKSNISNFDNNNEMPSIVSSGILTYMSDLLGIYNNLRDNDSLSTDLRKSINKHKNVKNIEGFLHAKEKFDKKEYIRSEAARLGISVKEMKKRAEEEERIRKENEEKRKKEEERQKRLNETKEEWDKLLSKNRIKANKKISKADFDKFVNSLTEADKTKFEPHIDNLRLNIKNELLEAEGDTFIDDGTKLEKIGGITDGPVKILGGRGIAGEAGKETILPHKANERFKKLVFNAVAMTFGREKALDVLEQLEPNELTLRDMGLNTDTTKFAEGGTVQTETEKKKVDTKNVTTKSSIKEILIAQLDMLSSINEKTIYGINFEQFVAAMGHGKDFMSEWFHRFKDFSSDKLGKAKTYIGGKLNKVKSFGSTVKGIVKAPFGFAGSALFNKRMEVYRLSAEGEPLGDPLITDKDWKDGLYTDPDCKNPLKSVDDISGPVWGSDGHKRIDDTDIKAGLCDENRKPISSKVRKLGRLLRKAVMGSVKLATLPFRSSSTMIWNTIYNKTCDVYKNPNDKNVGLGDALVTKQDFVDGLYADPEKKKRITSVADIKGDVYNNKGERVIKKEDLPLLCDEKRRPINSFASRLGRTFRGAGGFVFDKISQLKPLEKLGKLANLPFTLLHKINSVNCDVYSNRDPNTVLVTADDFKRGRVMDEDGKLIRAASDIKGKVWWTKDPVNGEKAGQLAINDEDLEKGLIDNKGNEIKSRFRFIAGIGLNGVTTAAGAIVGVGKGILNVAKHVGSALFFSKDKFIDVYADDENGKRVLKLEGKKIKEGKYLIKHKETFTQLKSAYGIDGEVYITCEDKPKLVLSLDDIRNGLYDVEGHKLTKYRGMSLVGAAGSMLMGGAKKVIGGIGKGIVGLGKMVSGAWNAGKDFFSSMFSGITSSIKGSGLFLNRRDLEEVVGDRLLDIYHLLYVRLPDKKKVNGDTDGDGDRDGSYEDWLQRKEERKRKRAEKDAAKKGNTKGGVGAGITGDNGDTVDNDGSITDTLMNLWLAKDLLGGVKAVGGKALDGLKWAGGKVLNGVKAVGGKALNGVKAVGGKALNGVKAVGGKVLGGAGNLVGKVAVGGGKTLGAGAKAISKSIAKSVGMRALATGLGAVAGANIWNPVGWALLATSLGVLAYDVLKTDPMVLKWQRIRFKYYGADKSGVAFEFAHEDYLKDLEKATFKAMLNEGALDMSELEHFGRNVGMLYSGGIAERVGGINTDSMREDKENRLEYLKEWYVKRFYPAFDMYTTIVKSHEEGGEADSFPDVRLIPFGFQDDLCEQYEKMCSKLPQEYEDFDLYSINDSTGYEKWLERKKEAEQERRANLSPQELKLEDAKKALANDDKWRYDSTADNFSQAWYNLKNWNWGDAAGDLVAGIGSLLTNTLGGLLREVGGWFTTSANYDAWASIKKDLYGLDSGCDIENVRELEELATRVWLGKRRDISRAEVKGMISAVDGPEDYDDFVKTACAECGVDESEGEDITNSYILTWFRRRFIPINKVYTAVICALTGEKPGDMLDVDDIPDQYREDALDQMTKKCNDILKENDIDDLKLDTASFADYLFKRGINDLENVNKLKAGLSLGERAAESFAEGTDHLKKAWDKVFDGDVLGGIWEGIKGAGSFGAAALKGFGAIGDKIGFWLCDMFGDTPNEVYWKMRFESYKLSETVTNAIIAGNGDYYIDAIEELEELAQEIIDGEESLNDEDTQEDILDYVSILYARRSFKDLVGDKFLIKLVNDTLNPNSNKEKSPRDKLKRFFLLWFKMSFLPAFLVLLSIHRQYTKQGKGTEVDVDDFPEDCDELFEEFKKGAKQAHDQTGGPVLDEESFVDIMSERARNDSNSVLNKAEAIEAKEEENTLKSAISKNMKASSVVDKNTQTKVLAKLNLNRAAIKNDINLIGGNVKELMKWFADAYGVWGGGTDHNSPENLRKIKHKYYGIDGHITKDFNGYIDELEKHAFDELFKGESPDEKKLKKILENIAVETGLYKSESGTLWGTNITEPETSRDRKFNHLKKWYCLRFVPVYSTYCEIVTAIREATTPEYVTDDFITSLPVLKVMTLFKLMDKYLPNSIIDEGKMYGPNQSSYDKVNERVGESKGRQQAAEKYNRSGGNQRTVEANNSNTEKGTTPTKHARGGIVNQETRFNFGIAGEAGPESIVPLRDDGRFDSLIAESVDIAKGRDVGDMVRNALRGDSENISELPSKDLFKSLTKFTKSSSGDLTSLSRMLNVDGLSARDLLAGLFSLQLVNLSMASRGTVDGKNKPRSAEDEENGVSDILSNVVDGAGGILSKIGSGVMGTFEALSGLGKSMANPFSVAGNYIADKASSAWNTATNFVSGAFGGDNVKPVTSISNTPADVKARIARAWKMLKSSGLTDEAVAAVLGNVKKEAGSEFTSVIRQGDTRDRTHKKSFEYTVKYDSDKQAFTGDRDVGYGLCQWTYHTRKAALWDFAHGKKKSIGDFDTQVEFIIHELNTTHKGVRDKLKGCKDLLKATALVLRGYEQPARQDDVELRERYGYAKEIYSMFSGNSDEQLDSVIKESSQISSSESSSDKPTVAGANSNPTTSEIPETGTTATGNGAELAKYANIKPGVNTKNLNPVLANNFAGMAKEFKETVGKAVTITSGARTMAQQQALYNKYGPARAARPNPLAPHISGLALDANSADMNKAEQMGLLDKYNLWRPLKNWSKTKEPWHVEVKGSRDPKTGTITQASLDKINSLANTGASVANSALQSMPSVVAASMDEQQEKSEASVKDMSIVSAAAGKELENRKSEFTTSTNSSVGVNDQFSTSVSKDTPTDAPAAIDQEKLSELQMMTNLLGDIKELLRPDEQEKLKGETIASASTTKSTENKGSDVDKLLPVLIELVKNLSAGASSSIKSVATDVGQSTRTRSVNFPLNIAKA